MPTFDGSDDVIGIGGPDEGFALPVVRGEVAIDSGVEVDDGMEDVALETPLRQLGEEALDGKPLEKAKPAAAGGVIFLRQVL